VTYAFVGEPWLRGLGLGDEQAWVRIKNPLREEQAVMRPTLLVGLLGALERNLARDVPSVRIFEVGRVFRARAGEPLPDEPRHAAGLIFDRAAPADVLECKGVVEELLAAFGVTADFVPSTDVPWLHPGIQAQIVVGGQRVGELGELHPDVARSLALEACPVVFELALHVLGQAPPVRFEELPRFPSVARDLSFFIDAGVSARAIAEAIERARDPLLVRYAVVEDYREPGKVPEGKKGMLWSFTYRATDRTLTDAEVQPVHERLRARLVEALGLQLR
jgi:phenylalanyl-tRNA synthetase beta chain